MKLFFLTPPLPTKTMSNQTKPTNFQHFHDTWMNQLQQILDQLNQSPHHPSTPDHHPHLTQLVQKTMSHFSEYYRVKALSAREDILSIIDSPWSTALEKALLWISGWRPTTAFHLMYTEASMKFESQMAEILRGRRNGDLGDLSPAQLSRVSELQCETVAQENAINDELSQWQDGACELIGLGSNVGDKKMEELVRIVEMADELRMKTIESLADLLSPRQAVEFLIAAIELQFGLRGWGFNFDRLRG